jgi:putative molybdopterin biosynthesis protein
MDITSSEYLTTAEAAEYLRLGERKLYELVAEGRIPCTKATGKWLFPRAALDRWLIGGMNEANGSSAVPSPPVVGGSGDPLLEWALRESGSGLALLPEGSETGLRRLRAREIMMAGIHLHRIEGPDENANTDAVINDSGLADAVVIAWVKREQGIVVAPGNPLGFQTIKDVAAKRAKIAERQTGAGAQALLMRLAKIGGIEFESLSRSVVARTGDDLALAVREGRADCGIATRAVAATRGLGFVSLIWERFDLVMRRRDYFEPGPQALFTLMRNPAFSARAAALSGYDTSESGRVVLNR